MGGSQGKHKETNGEETAVLIESKNFMKCRNIYCENEKSTDRAECPSCRGKRRRGTLCTPKFKVDENLKILMVDIETYPNTVYAWDSQLWTGHISIEQIKEPGGILCFASKWYGNNEVEFYSKWDDGDLQMKTRAWELMDEADIIVHYFGSRFDVPWLNAAHWKMGLFPPSPFKQVDLKIAVSKRFQLPSNKLQFVSQVLGLEGKEEHEGFRLWKRVMDGDVDARKRMEVYNIRDTTLLEEVYEHLLPWIPNHPNRNLYSGQGDCPRCGFGPVLRNGFAYTSLSKFEGFRCDYCGSPLRNSKRLAGVSIQDYLL